MKEIWNKRYDTEQYVYGKLPNRFFKENIGRLNEGSKILFPAEGEGRNVVFAAKMGHTVVAFDISKQGKSKAMQLAKEENVQIEYFVGELSEISLPEQFFDAAVLTSAHFPPHLRQKLHRDIGNLVKPGGFVILEGFSVENLKLRLQNPKIGGPDKIEMLFTKEMLVDDFETFEVVLLEETETELKEGLLHDGIAKVIRFIGKKL